MGALYQSGPNSVLTFVFVTLILGGAASMAAGRALASSWRPIWHCILYAVPIAVAAGFLHYALFAEPVIPLYAIANALFSMGEQPSASLGRMIYDLRGLAFTFVIQAILGTAGYILTRRKQMARQYGFTRG
jgi:hypothetical protein